MKEKVLTRELAGELLRNSKDEKVIIPNGITIIDAWAFYNYRQLTSIVIPDSVKIIKDYAFYKCSGLASVTIPNSVKTIGKNAFSDCSGLISINVDAANTHYTSVDGVLFNYAQDTLIQYPIGNSRTEYIIPNSVTTIGELAFSDCSGLTSITIPNSVTSIGISAFSHCNLNRQRKYDSNNKLIAYKGFNIVERGKLRCRDTFYEEGKSYKKENNENIELCSYGFHACLNPLDCINYYSGVVGKNVEYHKVYLSGEIKFKEDKIVASEITIGEKVDFSKVCI